MSATYEYECVNRIKSLKQSIESTTGKTYGDLTEAIQGLKDSGGNVEDFLNDFVVKNADLGDVVLSDDGTVMGLVSNGLRQGAFAECYVGNVTIPEGVETIPMWCFYDTIFRRDTTVILPNSLRTIEREAFLQAKMKNITIPEGVTSIGERAFHSCSQLQSIVIPASVTTIGEDAFSFCPKLSTITFNSTPTTLPYLFVGCSQLTTINVPWSEGAVSGAPWGATKATINYNYTGG